MDQFRQNKTNINKSNKRRKNVKEKFNKDNLENELKKLKDDNLRHLAEIDNLRKRFDKEKEDIFKYAITDFANEIILVVDNFERVIDNISSIDKKNNEKYCIIPDKNMFVFFFISEFRENNQITIKINFLRDDFL